MIIRFIISDIKNLTYHLNRRFYNYKKYLNNR
jgi:hypothetical protein